MSANGEFQIGVAVRDISPPQPTRLKPTGMGRLVPTRGVLDPLRVEAMAIRAGGELAFVTSSDLRTVWIEWVQEIREAVAARTGCDPGRVLISGTHNHCSSPEAADDSPEAKAALEAANRKIIDGFIDACVEGAGSLRPAEIATATFTLREPVGQNRRFRLSNGTCVNTWGSGPVIPPGMKAVGPGGPDSDRADVLVAREVGAERPFALFISYPSHPHLCALPYFSGEFPGAVKRRVERLIPGATAMQASHAGGNIDLHCIHPMPDGEPAQVQWFKDSAELLAERFTRDLLPAIPTGGYSRPSKMRHEYWSTEGAEPAGSKRLTVLNAVALGDVALVSMPGELFIELAQDIHAASPFPHNILMGYNGSRQGYVPRPLGFEQGSYEVMRGPSLTVEEDLAQPSSVRSRIETGREITAKILEIL
ncbi:MAG TPA: hypothetical protein VNA25_07790, partial [Phycisphaerae bacterium]|nr:hypothetical protein [Phycisphaerae bacterium]